MTWVERDREHSKGETGMSGAGSGVGKKKNHTLIGDVSEYWGFYKCGGC